MPRLYHWDDWLKPDTVVTLTRGTHFHCSMQSMYQQVRNAGRAVGLHVSIAVSGKTLTVTVTERKKPKKTKPPTVRGIK